MKDKCILTAESVTEGHPDKLCDTIADAVLDACLEHDPSARVACEAMATAGKIIVAGEITAKELPDIPSIVRGTVQRVGYTCDFDVEVRVHEQSADIAGAVDGCLGNGHTVQYIGIAKDEPERLARLGGNQVSLLEKYDYTEADAKQLCQRAGLLSPVYDFTDRGGCWFCPNAKMKELHHLYDHHPDLWARMLELQALPGKVSEKFNRTMRFSDIDEKFRQEDAQESLFRRAA